MKRTGRTFYEASPRGGVMRGFDEVGLTSFDFEELMTLSGATTKRDCVNTAITLLAWTLRQVQEGRKIVSLDDEQKVCRELDLQPLFAEVRKRSVVKSCPVSTPD